MDKFTKDRIATLHPSIREEMRTIITECNAMLTGKSQVRSAQALRTIKEQDALYAQGRTKPGLKVTNAKGGQSIHTYGFAVDIVLIIDGKAASWDTNRDWDNDRVADWYECVKAFAKYGWEWGGNWKTGKDLPHFDKKGYNDWRKLAKMPKDAKGYVILKGK